MRQAAKVDDNQPSIVEALRKCGVKVYHTHQIGGGFPDLLCWHRNRYVLLEVKMLGKKPNKDQEDFIAACPGELHVVHTITEALEAVLGEKVMA